ncbi:MAG TPA: response regulator [Pseudomonadota bacterium]|nr:response regulator [Pseudomonadota bacterium]
MDDLLRQVIHVFVEEVREQAQRIAEALLRMEESPSTIPVEIEELYRQAHSLKGSSGSLGITDLEQLAHWVEQVLMPVRRERAPLTPSLVDLCLQAMAAAQERIPGLLADSGQGSAEVNAVIAALQKAAGPSERTPAPSGNSEEAAPIPASSEPVVTPAAAPAQKGQEVPSALRGSDGSEAVRISIERLIAFERRSDELRALRGRLERHISEANQLCQTLERLTTEARESTLPPAEVLASQRDELRRQLRSVRTLRRELLEDSESLQATTTEFDDNLRTMRLVPASLLVQPLTLTVREACRFSGRDAALEIIGDQVHVDRLLLEELKNPLIHLVRNAVDHGIEAREVREAIGKPGRGQIRCSIEQHGGEIVFTLTDDGRGIDQTAVREKAIERGLLSAAQADVLSEKQTYDLLLLPGFTTTEVVTALSGRGVGLDVVNMAVVRLHGSLEIQSTPGRGTSVRVTVPMTMAASRLMLFAERDWVFALPQASISRVMLVRRDQLVPIGSHHIFRLGSEAIRVARLRQLIGEPEQAGSGQSLQVASMPLLILRGPELGEPRSAGDGPKPGGMRLGVLCERTLGESDLVLRALPAELQGRPPLSAVALLANGSAVFVLSAPALMQQAEGLPEQAPAPRTRVGTVLVADDSITTRSLLRSVLEVGGYDVRTASDGDEALRVLANEAVSLIVSDVRMPRLDGLSLVTRLRADPRTAAIPVVLFSSSDSEEDRRIGLASGANAYLSKGAFERGQLIDVVKDLLRGAA